MVEVPFRGPFADAHFVADLAVREAVDGKKPEDLLARRRQFPHHLEDVVGKKLVEPRFRHGLVAVLKNEEMRVPFFVAEMVGQRVPNDSPDPSFEAPALLERVQFLKNAEETGVHDLHRTVLRTRVAEAHLPHFREKTAVKHLLRPAVVVDTACDEGGFRPVFFSEKKHARCGEG